MDLFEREWPSMGLQTMVMAECFGSDVGRMIRVALKIGFVRRQNLVVPMYAIPQSILIRGLFDVECTVFIVSCADSDAGTDSCAFQSCCNQRGCACKTSREKAPEYQPSNGGGASF